jgi:hypothetical protein
MPPRTRQGLEFDIGTIAHTAYDDAGWIGVRMQGYAETESDAGLGDSELQTQFGFTSRPVDRTAAGGCESLYASAGNSESFAFLGKDARYTAQCPPLYQGSSVHWASDGQFILLDTEKHTSTWYVLRGSVAHVITVGEDANGNSTISLQHSNGSYVTINQDGVTARGIGDSFLNVNGSEVAINGKATTTASMTVGGVAALSVAKADPIIAYLGALESLLSALAGAIDGKTPSSPGVSAGVVTAFISASSTFKAALKAQMLATV